MAKNEADVCSTPPKWRKTEQVHAETLSKKGNSIHLVGFSPKSSLFFVEKIPGARSPQTKADIQQNKAAALEQRNRIRKPRPQAQREGERRQTNDGLNAKRSAWQDFRRKREDSSDGGVLGLSRDCTQFPYTVNCKSSLSKAPYKLAIRTPAKRKGASRAQVVQNLGARNRQPATAGAAA